jgi:hypothetical protein
LRDQFLGLLSFVHIHLSRRTAHGAVYKSVSPMCIGILCRKSHLSTARRRNEIVGVLV